LALRLSDPSSPPPRAVLDADVIFSRVLHELLGRIATELRLLTLVWSDELLAEAERALLERKDLPAAAARRWVGYLRDAFPDERIDFADLPAGIDPSRFTADRDDQHICALALAGRADLLLTFDRGYLRAPLGEHGVRVIDPDEYLRAAFDQESSALIRILRAQASVWGGGRPIEDLLDAIERAGAPKLAARARDALAG
jgi:predicted nucleic acid-binding protein